VLEIEPRFLWALNELGQTYLVQAEYDRLHGGDPRVMIERALKCLDQAMGADPDFTLPLYAKIRAINYRLVYETDHGLDATDTLRLQSDALSFIDKRKLGGFLPAYYGAKALRFRAAFELSTGADPTSSIAAALEKIHAFADPGTETGYLLRELAELGLVEAAYGNVQAILPVAVNVALRDAVKKDADEEPASIDLNDLLARVTLTLAEVKVKNGEAVENDFDVAIDALKMVIAKERNDPRPYLTLAEIETRKAKWLASNKKPVDVDVAKGLKMANKVLAIHPHSAQALICKAALLLLLAKSSTVATRKQRAREAMETFGAAFRENPRMENSHRSDMNSVTEMQ
jgi:serine/threonine-protein kinase